MNAVAVSFILYTLAIMALGVYSARFAKRSSSDFFLASRGLGSWVAALSSSASAESGWVMLGLVGTSFKVGLPALWIIPGTILAFLFNWLVVGERLRKMSRKHDAVTITDLMASPFRTRYAFWIRLFSFVIIITMLTAYVAAQMTSAAKMFEAAFDWQYGVGVLVGAGIVLIYTVIGGFRAVAWTDVVQAVFMVLAMVVLPIVLLVEIGGFGIMLSELQKAHPSGNTADLLGGNGGLALLGFFALWLGIPMGNPGQPHILVRFMATKDEQAIRRGAIISTAWVTLLFTGAVLLGLAARVYYGVLADPEQALPIAATDFMPGAIAGIMIAAVMAAVCSTADSQLLVAASSFSHDLYARHLNREATDRRKVFLNRMTVLLVGVAAAAVAFSGTRVIFDFVLYAWAGLGAAFGPALVLLLLWRRTTAAGVLAGMIVGFATTVVWINVKILDKAVYEMIPALGAAFVAVIGVSLLTRSNRDEVSNVQ